MDAEKALKSEIFRPVVITIVPGLIALSPYLFVAAYFHPDVSRQIKGNELLAVAIILTIAIAVGHVLEDIGSRIELVLCRRKNKWHAVILKTSSCV